MIKTIDVLTLKNLILGGASSLKKNIETVNSLNVFPVPDGDTGSNMYMTVEGGIKAINGFNTDDASLLIKTFARGAMFGARGNSGVILSEFFKGFSQSLNLKEITVKDIKSALENGVKFAYSAVENPVEGTILTVFKESTNYVLSSVLDDATIEDLLTALFESAEKSLVKTKQTLQVLKEADVVDSGGAGYVYFLQGVILALTGEEVSLNFDDFSITETAKVDYNLFTSDSVLTYGYCTEVLLRLQNAKINVSSFDEKELISYLKSIGGDSIVVSVLGDIVKIHVHTFEPGSVLIKLRNYGEFLTVKIENMNLQHNQVEDKKPRKKTAIVAVANGNGVKKAFLDLGVDYIIEGGQTLNPSTSDFIEAFDCVNADNIIVLPNNSNVILTAKQSKKAYDKSNVYVVETKSIQQGFVVTSIIDAQNEDIEYEIESAMEVASEVTTIDVTYAVRNATVNGKTVIKGDYMAISGKELLASSSDKIKTAINAIKNLQGVKDKELLTVFFGSDVTSAEKDLFEEEVMKFIPDISYCPYDGNQSVYSFLISLE